ncbi:protein phosphatase 2C domain-containing protein [Conchiformibius steedae DSM 2580]|uniref:Protein phosphatase 2C domain-containing protein n=1 Tax=Conchiformibius steedae DSM 2580 TaxID=1121352 RepID=A0AAE9KZN6_9NEIS|nr:protein phosphatase 2C domain-containing protein [Conchiformibius steedae]QMT32877.1 protein phosphatase 2C domain-containing protein [Conchiformibius steedae]URD67491.1 protein phosphatase 2C domain-containing protein [Conchiformibius steedae DSM 2580]
MSKSNKKQLDKKSLENKCLECDNNSQETKRENKTLLMRSNDGGISGNRDLESKNINTGSGSSIDNDLNTLGDEKSQYEAIRYLGNRYMWLAQYDMVVGLNHKKPVISIPCQDAAFATSSPRPMIMIADGAGSSVVSDLGAVSVITGVARFLYTMERSLVNLLDGETSDKEDDGIRTFSLLIVKHAKGILEDLSILHRRPIKDFRCTLLLGVVGKAKTMWLKVGDGALVVEKKYIEGEEIKSELQMLGEVGKGEFANYTTFIDENIQFEDVQSGVLSSDKICALFAMSDGAAEKLVANDGTKIADRLVSWADLLRNNKLNRRILTTTFYSDAFLNNHTGDDCSVAIISSKFNEC